MICPGVIFALIPMIDGHHQTRPSIFTSRVDMKKSLPISASQVRKERFVVTKQMLSPVGRANTTAVKNVVQCLTANSLSWERANRAALLNKKSRIMFASILTSTTQQKPGHLLWMYQASPSLKLLSSKKTSHCL